MKILIVSYYFAPANIIGAVRFTKLTKYFSRLGCETKSYVSCENRWLFLDSSVAEDKILRRDVEGMHVNFIEHSKWYKTLTDRFKIKIKSTPVFSKESSPTSIIKTLKSKFFYTAKKNALLLLSLLQDLNFCIRVLKDASYRADISDADCLITTYGPYAPHFIGLITKLLRKDIKWVADFRDPIYQPTDPLIVAQFHRLLERLVCRYCDQIVCVSHGYQESVVAHRYRHKSVVITNGFDQEDLINVSTEPVIDSSEAFVISYTGTTYAGRRDLTPLLDVLVDLFSQRLIPREMVEFHYAGPESDYIAQLFSAYGLSDILVNLGAVSRTEALATNKRSSLTIVATWDDDGHRGVLPGKLYELMMFDASLLALVSTDIGKSEISTMLAGCENAYCFESNNQNGLLELKHFVQRIYELKMSKNTQSDSSGFNHFSYSEISKRYLGLIESLVVKREQ